MDATGLKKKMKFAGAAAALAAAMSVGNPGMISLAAAEGKKGRPASPAATAGQQKDEATRRILPIKLISRASATIPPDDPFHAAWNSAPVTTLKLIPQDVQEPMLMAASVRELRVRSLHDHGWIAFLLEWDDPSRDAGLRSDRFSDAAAVSFPLSTAKPLPNYQMGDEERPVHLVLWKAYRQRVHEEKVSLLAENYPYAWTDAYAFEPKAVGHLPGQASLTEQKEYLPAQAAGNPSAVGVAPVVEELNARTWNQMTVQPSQDARGRALWKDRRWRLMIARPLVASDGEDASLSGQAMWPMAFAVWDGAKENNGPRKMVSEGWIQLTIEKK